MAKFGTARCPESDHESSVARSTATGRLRTPPMRPAHGGFVMPDGSVRADVKIDVETLGELSRVARREFGMGEAVQHGASTLPAEAFDAFPRVGACEIHLATDFQNMIYEHPRLPKALKDEMYAWVRVNAADERKAKDTEEQFLYKSRKKAIGAFKRQLWDLPADVQGAIGRSLEEKFTFLMKKLAVPGTAEVVRKHVPLTWVERSRDDEIVAAGGIITAAERKAEGLHDWDRRDAGCPSRPQGGLSPTRGGSSVGQCFGLRHASADSPEPSA